MMEGAYMDIPSEGKDSASTPTDEQAHSGGCYAVVMALEANRKTGHAALVIVIVAILGRIYFHSWWFIAGGIALCVATFFYLTQSCIRYVERTIGMPPDVQALFNQLYKKDPAFAKEVDAKAHGSRKMADALDLYRKSK
jgi:hypothetical protein